MASMEAPVPGERLEVRSAVCRRRAASRREEVLEPAPARWAKLGSAKSWERRSRRARSPEAGPRGREAQPPERARPLPRPPVAVSRVGRWAPPSARHRRARSGRPPVSARASAPAWRGSGRASTRGGPLPGGSSPRDRSWPAARASPVRPSSCRQWKQAAPASPASRARAGPEGRSPRRRRRSPRRSRSARHGGPAPCAAAAA